MRLVDANVLLYAHLTDFAEHDAARAWLEDKMNGTDPLALPWPSLLAFVRLSTNRQIFRNPISMEAAWAQVENWLSVSVVWQPQPGKRHRELLQSFLVGTGVTSNAVPDAHLAALAVEHGLIVCSADTGFGRFAGVRWENPLRSVS